MQWNRFCPVAISSGKDKVSKLVCSKKGRAWEGTHVVVLGRVDPQVVAQLRTASLLVRIRLPA